jgi:hypothetical protein
LKELLQKGMIEVIDDHGVVTVDGEGGVRRKKIPYQFVIPKDTIQLISNLPARKKSNYVFGIGAQTAWRIVTRVAEQCGYQKQTRRRSGKTTMRIHPETLRRYFKDRMTKAGADGLLLQYLMGNSVTAGTDEKYHKDQLLQTVREAETRGMISVL